MIELAEVGVEGFGNVRIRMVRPQGHHLIVYLNRVTHPDRARALVDREVFADPAALPPAPVGSVYVASLPGLPVEVEGDPLGEVTGLIDAGGQSLLRVATTRGELLLPLAAPYVHLGAARVEVIDPPTGLLDGR